MEGNLAHKGRVTRYQLVPDQMVYCTTLTKLLQKWEPQFPSQKNGNWICSPGAIFSTIDVLIAITFLNICDSLS